MNASERLARLDLILAMRKEGFGVSQIAELFGLTRNVTYVAISKQEKIARRLENIIAMRREGRTLDSIGQELGLTRERVRQIIAKFGADPKPYKKHNKPVFPILRFKSRMYAHLHECGYWRCGGCGLWFTPRSNAATKSPICDPCNRRRAKEFRENHPKKREAFLSSPEGRQKYLDYQRQYYYKKKAERATAGIAGAS
jgi:DNA-binding transcriptional MerR regulator